MYLPMSHLPASQGSVWKPGKTHRPQDGPQQGRARPPKPQEAAEDPRLRAVDKHREWGLTGAAMEGRGTAESLERPHLRWKGALHQSEVSGPARYLCREGSSARWGGGRGRGPRAPLHMPPGSRRAPTGHIGPQGHLVVVDNPSRSRAPEVGPKVVVVHLGGAESALEARTQV